MFEGYLPPRHNNQIPITMEVERILLSPRPLEILIKDPGENIPTISFFP